MDLEILMLTTYEMEGERLEILLLFSRFKAIRQLGRSVKNRAQLICLSGNRHLRYALPQAASGTGMNGCGS